MSMAQLSDAYYCRARRDLEMQKAWRARRDGQHIWVHLCTKEARHWNWSLLREMRKVKS
jgi:hypothetical protein